MIETEIAVEAAPVVAEVATPAQKQAQPAPAPKDQLNEAGHQVKTILEMIEKDPSLVDRDPFAKKLKEDWDAYQKTQTTQKPATQKSETETEEEQEEETETEEEEEKSIFFKKEKGKITKVESLEEANKIAKERFGQPSLPKLIDSAQKWREDSKQLGEVQKKYENIESFITNLPPPIYKAMELFEKGQDWQAALKVPNINFDKEFSKQKDKVTKHYFSHLTEDQLSEPDDVTKQLIQAAEVKFDAEKMLFDSSRRDIETKAAARKDSLLRSISSTVESLRTTFPDMDADKAKEVEKVLKSGNIDRLFSDATGAYLPDAATRIALALYGKEEIESKSKKSFKKGKNDGLMEKVAKGKTTVTESKDQVVAQPAANFSGWNAKSPYEPRDVQPNK